MSISESFDIILHFRVPDLVFQYFLAAAGTLGAAYGLVKIADFMFKHADPRVYVLGFPACAFGGGLLVLGLRGETGVNPAWGVVLEALAWGWRFACWSRKNTMTAEALAQADREAAHLEGRGAEDWGDTLIGAVAA